MRVFAKHDYFPQFYDQDTNFFRYEELLKLMLKEAESTLSRIQLPTGLSIAMSNGDFHPDQCPRCTELSSMNPESIYQPWTHCLGHLPVVAQTRLGLCLILQFQDEGMMSPTNVVIDLIPGIPVPETDTLSIYRGVVTSLLKDLPPGYQKTISSLAKRDRVIPDDMMEMSTRNFEDTINFLGVKLLSWGPGRNYHLRPGQVVKVAQFADTPTKKAYLVLKALIKMLDIDISSYLLKKALLGSSTYRVNTMPLKFIVSNTMSTPELQSEFSKYVLEDQIDPKCNYIPLTLNGQQRLRDLEAQRRN